MAGGGNSTWRAGGHRRGSTAGGEKKIRKEVELVLSISTKYADFRWREAKNRTEIRIKNTREIGLTERVLRLGERENVY